MSAQFVVELNEVTKKIKGKTIVDRLSFQVKPGEVFGFLGPNGAGKTTAIRMMVGLMSMSAGEVFIRGFSVASKFEQAMQHVGAIVENPEFYGFMTGYQNLKHYARMNGNVSEERIQEAVKLVRLDSRIGDKVKTYSLGMRQRLGVAQAILHRPSVLILDEPTNGLDPEGIRELRDYLRGLAANEGIAIIVSSHLLSEMELMCDRIAIIQNGKLLDVRAFREKNGDAELLEMCFEVDQCELAVKIAMDHGCESVTMEGETRMIAMLPDEGATADLNAQLVRAGIRVFGIRQLAKSLEDQFLEVTRGNRIV